MRSLSIQSLMISVTAAFSGLLALRWSDCIIHFYSWVQTMHRSSFQDDSQTTYVTQSYFLTYLVFRLWPILVFFTSSVIVLREQNMAFNILTNTHGMLLYLITSTKKIKSFVSLYVKPQAVIGHGIVTAVIFWKSLTIAKCIKFSII